MCTELDLGCTKPYHGCARLGMLWPAGQQGLLAPYRANKKLRNSVWCFSMQSASKSQKLRSI
eukprot:1143876-Pelagomonas_calceolata.AAC.3